MSWSGSVSLPRSAAGRASFGHKQFCITTRQIDDITSNRVLIVADRLPLTVRRASEGVELVPSSGGLATGLRPWHGDREKEILHLLAEGRSNNGRDALDVGVSTIETHRANLMQKLNLHNTAEFVLYAVREGIIV